MPSSLVPPVADAAAFDTAGRRCSLSWVCAMEDHLLGRATHAAKLESSPSRSRKMRSHERDMISLAMRPLTW